MAKNANHDGDGPLWKPGGNGQGPIVPPDTPPTIPPVFPDGKTRSSFSTESQMADKLSDLKKRPKWLVSSFLAIAAIMVLSFFIPEEYYTKNMNIFLLNVEIMILIVRDLYLYFKRSCKITRVIMLLMTLIYGINIIDWIIRIPYIDYLTLSISVVSVMLGGLFFISRK